MTSPPDAEKLSALPGRSVRGMFYRSLLAAFAPEPLSVEGSLQHGGRYNPLGAFGAMYCGENPAVCAAEIRRRAQHHPAPRYRLARIHIDLHRVLDLTAPATLAALGLRAEDLVTDNWEPTQRLGAAARAAGFEGLLVPSAAGPGRNLVIFPDRVDARSRIRSLGSRPFRLATKP
ncbi:MAG TPA: RES family NAD+ phosphorylase [Candidatus Methylomirabilis sp.]